MTKWATGRVLKKPTSHGDKLASKGAYMGANHRRMQVQRIKIAEIATNFSFIGAISAVVGFVSALGLRGRPWRMYRRAGKVAALYAGKARVQQV